MTDSKQGNGKGKDKAFKVEDRDDGKLFYLNNDVKLLLAYATENKVRFQFWTDDAISQIDEANIYISGKREKIIREQVAPILFGEPTDETARKRTEKLLDDFAQIATLLNTPTVGGVKVHTSLSPKERKNTVTDHLVRYARAKATFFHTPDRKPYAAVKVGDHIENYEIREKGGGDFGDWLEGEYWDKETARLKATAPSSPQIKQVDKDDPIPDVIKVFALNDALRLLRGMARQRGKTHEVYRRVAGYGKGKNAKIYIDLGDRTWRVIEVTRKGWRIIPGKDAPVKFARTPGMLAIAEPERGGSLEPLRKLLHLGDGEQEKRNWHLIVAWVVQALSPYGAYSVLCLFGNQGSGKSSTQRVLRHLVDHNSALLRPRPADDRNLFIQASNAWTVSLENMSKVPEWLSNALCVIATDGSYGIRAHYENDEEVLFHARRPVLINGIGDILTYPDLLDRAAIVRHPAFNDEGEKTDPTQEEEDVFLEMGKEIAPGVLGAALDCLVYYLAHREEIPKPRTRMVTFARFGTAVERYLGWGDGAFMKSYRASRGEATAQVMDSLPVAGVLVDFLEDYPEDGPWQSTAKELLGALNSHPSVTETTRQDKDWPKAANALSHQLNILATDLGRSGVYMERITQKGTRLIRLYKREEEEES